MTRRCIVVLALVAGSASALGQPPPPRPQRPGEVMRPMPRPAAQPGTEATAIVRGRVTAADGSPLRLARIAMVEATTRRSIGEATDADGRYEFREVPAGTYTVTARKAGFATMEFGQRRPADPGKRIRVADAETVERIDLTLPAAAAVAGRVIDENGDPVEGAAVSIYTMTFVHGRKRLVASGAERRTDDLGRFRLFNINPGEYVISAAAATTGQQRMPGYAAAYYPGAHSLADAEVVAVKTGDDLSALELRLT